MANDEGQKREQRLEYELSFYFRENSLLQTFSIYREPALIEFSEKLLPRVRPDFLITKKNYPFMWIEVDPSQRLQRHARYPAESRGLLELARMLEVDYFIRTDLESILVFEVMSDEPGGPRPFRIESFVDLFQYFNLSLDEKDIEEVKAQILQAFYEVNIDMNDKYPELNLISDVFDNTSLIQELAYDPDGRYYYFRRNPEAELENAENRMFRQLLSGNSSELICRYSTLDTLFATITNKSYRMSSHIAMNDRGEVDYVDKYIDRFYKHINTLTLAELDDLNNVFISSCTTIKKRDDLTMFRLYGEDTRGVCMVLKIDKLLPPDFYISRISYAREDGSHPQLEYLRMVIDTIDAKLKVRFKLLYLDIWKHFFKSFDYSVEEEIRILYRRRLPSAKTGWCVTYLDKIISRHTSFDLLNGDFPVSLEEIILGPNFPEKAANIRQIELLLQDNNFKYVTVSHSKIESYRKN